LAFLFSTPSGMRAALPAPALLANRRFLV
jgi:hypothetical protein